MIAQLKTLIEAEHRFNLAVLEAVEARLVGVRLAEARSNEYLITSEPLWWSENRYSFRLSILDREADDARTRLLELRKGAP